MKTNKVDFTLCFRYLSKALVGDIKSIKNLFKNDIAFDNWMTLWKEGSRKKVYLMKNCIFNECSQSIISSKKS